MKKIKKIISILLAAILIMTSGIIANAETYSGTCGDNLTWEFDDVTGILTISGTGEMYSYDGGLKTPWYDISAKITEIVIEDGVTSVGNYALQNTAAVKITISDTVETIGDYGFFDISAVEELNLGACLKTIGKWAFTGGFKLKKLVLPDGLVSIGEHSFANCHIIEELIIPDSVVTIGDYAFSYCRRMKKLYLGASVKTFPIRAFDACEAIEEIQVSEDNQYYSNDEYGVLFNKNKTKLVLYPSAASYESYTIPDSVQVVGEYAFYDSNNLKSITTGENIKTIENCSFCGLDNLTSIEFHPGLEVIGYNAFKNCKNLKSIILPDTVTNVYDYAFEGCESLTDVYYSGTEEQWSSINISTRLNGNDMLLNANITYLYGHTCSFGDWTTVTDATCTEYGSEARYCSCGATETREISPLGHSAGEWETVSEATCTATGTRIKKCTVCDYVIEEEIIEATAHIDNDNDGICDDCNNDLNSNNEQECDHACHKSGIAGFFWQITRFFNKLFRTNQYCECGAAHY